MTAPRLVVYHAGCVDGLVAAWVAREHWDSTAEFLPTQYGDAPPDVRGREVLVVDFSYPRADLERMASEAVSLRVLDHHKTAREALDGLPFCTFDMDRSGAGIAWDVLAGGRRPWVVDYAEDRDLWRWKLEDSRAINAYLQVLPKTLDEIDRVRRWLPEQTARFGGVVLLAQRSYLDQTKGAVRLAVLAGHVVPVVNAGTFCVSELVGDLADGQPFAAAWHQTAKGEFVYSLRSRGDGLDVAEIARGFGGGGHRHAAGFTTPAVAHEEVSK